MSLIGRRVGQEIPVPHLFHKGGVDELELRFGRWEEYTSTRLAGEPPQHFLAFQRYAGDSTDSDGIHGNAGFFNGFDHVVEVRYAVLVVPIGDQNNDAPAW